MGSYTIGEAIQQLLEKSKWKHKVLSIRLEQEWEKIVGTPIARYTDKVFLSGSTLYVYTHVAALKQELYFGKEQLCQRINEYFGETIVQDVLIK
jgi:predicted nucleic acid-binding Zn ribbon protein